MTDGTVVVTGAATGVGAATCRHLAGLGFDVLAGVRREEDAALVTSWPGRVRAQRLDVTDPDQVAALVTAVTTAPGPLRALVNNADSTGQSRSQWSVTRTGNGHARRLLVEAAWHHRPRYTIGKTMRERWDLAPVLLESAQTRATGDSTTDGSSSSTVASAALSPMSR